MAARTSGVIQNFLNGVSRQPPPVRLSTQLEDQVNGYSTVVYGLRKRAPSKVKARLPEAFPATAARYHTINRDTTERYQTALSGSGIVVADFAGNARSVSAPNGYGYLATSNPAHDLEAITVADHTFVLNRAKTIQAASTASPTRLPEALIHVVAGNYSKEYRVLVDGFLVAHYQTPKGEQKDGELAIEYQSPLVVPANIAAALVGGATAPNGLTAAPVSLESTPGATADANASSGNAVAWLEASLPSTDWGIARYGNVIHLWNKLGNDFSIQVDGETELFRVHKGKEADFAKLPNSGPAGFVIGITGDKNTGFDDYYVQFRQSDPNQGRGSWKECVGPGVLTSIDPATLPHLLVREADGTFTFKPAEWDARECGDLETVPWPSFVGRKATGMIFWRNRLGLTTDENTILSQAGEFFTFFPKTVTAQLDSDPIDVAISHPDVSIIRHAVPYNEQLMLFSDRNLFRLSGDELMTPKTANIRHVAAYESTPAARPVLGGNSLFFADDDARSSTVRELIYDPDQGVKDVPSVTDHCRGYVPAGITKLISSSNQNVLAALTSTYGNRLYVYKYYWTGQEKVVSSWSYWDFGAAALLDATIVDTDVVLTIARPDGVFLETVSLDEGFTDGGDLVVHLDRRVHTNDLTVTYSDTLDETYFTLPYPAAGVLAVTATGWSGAAGVRVPIEAAYDNLVVVKGDLRSARVWFGFPYAFKARLTEIIAKQSTGNASLPMLTNGKLTIQTLTLLLSATGYARVVVSQKYRPTQETVFTGRRLGDPESFVGAPTFDSRPVRVPIMASADEIEIEVVNDSYQPSSLLMGEWQGTVRRIS